MGLRQPQLHAADAAALDFGARVIALLSPDYLASDYCAAEWQAAIAHDPLNETGRLIVMRVAECVPRGLLTSLAYWDSVPLRGDAKALRDVVLAAIRTGRHVPNEPKGKIFINYRRSNDAGVARLLYDRLEQEFAGTALFMDMDAIPPGADFVAVLERGVAGCDVFLAVIGKTG